MAEKLPPAKVPREPIAEDNNNEGDGDGGGWEDFDAGGGDDAFGGQDDDDDPLPDPHANDMQVRERKRCERVAGLPQACSFNLSVACAFHTTQDQSDEEG